MKNIIVYGAGEFGTLISNVLSYYEEYKIAAFGDDDSQKIGEYVEETPILGKDDLLILISSSGTSPNILEAAKFCKEKNIDLITLSGFSKDNELNKLGKINLHINSNHYNFIEMTHHIILLSIVDIFAQKILL